jgi:glutamyl-Q tRNA(Asp) synthetase
LHLGSLLAAVGSYLDARARRGEWLVRIEDVDRAREVAGAADSILRTLERFGLEWNGAVWRQSERADAYEAALRQLAAQGLSYRCSCTRAALADLDDDAAIGARGAATDSRYPGYCRRGPQRPDGPFATRFRVDGFGPVTVVDRLQPALTQSVDAAIGDFVVRRRDGFYAYQLAVVVDDAAQGITDVVRGLDLYDNTPRQRLLQAALGLPAPDYLHLPLVNDRQGVKLAKSRGAAPAAAREVAEALTTVLGWLGHPPPPVLRGASPQAQLEWAIACWDPSKIQGVTTVLAQL